ncbi:MAG: CBS domain-containing protein [Phycisphaerales bacterium]|jgi:acetoin utilization protein AcuB|nr:CBS domain-containing protein [Phycisphaerales bacterium]
MNISSIMTRDVVTVTMDESLRWIQQVFHEHRFHHLIVTDQGKVVGVISDRDVLKNVSPFIGKMAERTADLATLDRKAHQVMSRALIAVSPATLVRDAAKLMVEHRVSCLPVLDDDQRPVGIVTWRDLLRWMSDFIAADLPTDVPTLPKRGKDAA